MCLGLGRQVNVSGASRHFLRVYVSADSLLDTAADCICVSEMRCL